MLKKVDRKNRFVSMFDPKTGFYVRSGVYDENGKDTGIDPFMTQFPELIDVGVMVKDCLLRDCVTGMLYMPDVLFLPAKVCRFLACMQMKAIMKL